MDIMLIHLPLQVDNYRVIERFWMQVSWEMLSVWFRRLVGSRRLFLELWLMHMIVDMLFEILKRRDFNERNLNLIPILHVHWWNGVYSSTADTRTGGDFDASFHAAWVLLAAGSFCRNCCTDMALSWCGCECAGWEWFSAGSICPGTQRTDIERVSRLCECGCAGLSDFVAETFSRTWWISTDRDVTRCGRSRAGEALIFACTRLGKLDSARRAACSSAGPSLPVWYQAWNNFLRSYSQTQNAWSTASSLSGYCFQLSRHPLFGFHANMEDRAARAFHSRRRVCTASLTERPSGSVRAAIVLHAAETTSHNPRRCRETVCCRSESSSAERDATFAGSSCDNFHRRCRRMALKIIKNFIK